FPADWSLPARWAHRLLIPQVARRATRIITVSETSKRAIVNVLGVSPDKVAVIHPGVDDNLLITSAAAQAAVRRRLDLKEDFLLTVTASHPHKNLVGLLQAYDRWANAAAPPPLVVVGLRGRGHQQLAQRLAQRRASGRVVLAGWVDADELSALYH